MLMKTSMQQSMSSRDGYSDGRRDIEIQGKGLDFISRHNLEATSVSQNVKGKETLLHSEDQETTELNSRIRAQEKEIMHLREQISLASTRQLQALNEKYALERKFSELRMALDEKQSEVITAASNELARRKGDLEVNLSLLNQLKVVEDDRQIFTSATIGILAEFGALPHVANASALSNSIKHLHDRLQSRITISRTRLAELNSMIGNNARNDYADINIPTSRPTSQLPSRTMDAHGFPRNFDQKNSEPSDGESSYVQEVDFQHAKSLTQSVGMHQLPNNENFMRTAPGIPRNVPGQIADNMLNRNGYAQGSEQRTTEQFSHPHMMHDAVGGSFNSEDEGPGIEGFQIIGEAAKPGCKLLGCGYPVRGTSLCMFQWVRHYPDGTRQYIEGATNPDYFLTADDVDKLIAVECIPMDDQGRQGEIVRIFANDHNKITCDEDMQEEIDAYISKGLATFGVQILLDSSENWEQATLSLRRSGFQVKVEKQHDPVISEKYSKALLIKIPSGASPQFVLTCSNGSSYPFNTSDIRLRDTLVLTMRIFQNKALDEKRKGKA